MQRIDRGYSPIRDARINESQRKNDQQKMTPNTKKIQKYQNNQLIIQDDYLPAPIQEIRITCQRHQHVVTHGCAEIDCDDDVLFCSECLLQNLEHAHTHRKSIFSMEHFLTEFYQNIEDIKNQFKVFDEIDSLKDSHLQYYSQYILDQKEKINKELKEFANQFHFMLDKLRMNTFYELEQLESDLEEYYQRFSQNYHNSDLSILNIQSYKDLQFKLRQIGPAQIIPYLENLRSSMQNFTQPGQSDTMQNLFQLTNIINTYKTKTVSMVDINIMDKIENNFKALQSDIASSLGDYVKNISEPLQQLSTFQQLNGFDFHSGYKFPIRSGGTGGTANISPYGFKNTKQKNSRTSSPFQENTLNNFNQQLKSATASPINKLINTPVSPQGQTKQSQPYFDKGNLMSGIKQNVPIQQDLKGPNPLLNDWPSQKNQIVNNTRFFKSKEYALTLDTVMETDQKTSALCIIHLDDSYLAIGGKDSLIRIYQTQYIENDFDMIQVSQFQEGAGSSPIWSLCKITPSTQKNYKVYFIAAGTENGYILLWKFDSNHPSPIQSKPITYLSDQKQEAMITCIVDLEDGKCLVSGDSEGLITVWDYMNSELVQTYNLHTGQINCMISYNDCNNIAVGGYDGKVSLWQVQAQGQQQTLRNLTMIIDNGFVLSLSNIMDSAILITDVENNVKLVDVENFNVLTEVNHLLQGDPILEVLVIESSDEDILYPYLMCFTKNKMILFQAQQFTPIKQFEIKDLYSHNIGLTMCSNNKVVYLPNLMSAKLPIIRFAIIDQSTQTNRIASVFTVEY